MLELPVARAVLRPSSVLRRLLSFGAVLLFALLAIVHSIFVFSQVADEPIHVIAGLELLSHGSYSRELLHPPLARVFAAGPLFLLGARDNVRSNPVSDGNEVLWFANAYTRNLALARAAQLPFFLLAILVVYWWAQRAAVGTLAAILLVTQPTILAHAALATTDMAAAAMFVTALFVWRKYLEKPTWGVAAVLGACVGLSFLAKFSLLVFLPVCICLFLLWKRPEWRDVRHAPLAVGVLAFVIWAGYAFSMHRLSDFGPHAQLLADAHLQRVPMLHQRISKVIAQTPLPLTEFVLGVDDLRIRNEAGSLGFLLGECRRNGWWYYFPAALALKTPAPFILLVLIALARAVRQRDREALLLFACAGAMLVMSMPSNLNIGVRHVLPLIPILCIAVAWSLRMVSGKLRYAVAGLVVLQVLVVLRAHPDHLAYFNEFVHEPERTLLDSNLDWGQDLRRLEHVARERGMKELKLSFYGSADLTRHDLPRLLPLHGETTGWIAISEMNRNGIGFDRCQEAPFAWLEKYEPVSRVGKSIRLYYVK